MIIDREYRQKEKAKKGKRFIANEKFYRYRCLDCGNEDWVVEYSISEKQHCGCNACCFPPKKIVRGVNDVSTTAPWMMKYFANKQEIYSNSKYSKKSVQMVCPHCGRIYTKQIHSVFSNRGLACSCKDGWSYPNKFMFSVLEQANVKFEPEKRFDWSNNKIYDDYIEYNELKIITEQHGRQHYDRVITKSSRSRTLDEEKANDKIKFELAVQHGIDHYFVIDASVSTLDYLRQSIVNSGLLDLIDITEQDINWNQCNEFALSNLAKEICTYKKEHYDIPLRKIAKKYNISYMSVLRYIKLGNAFGWCEYNFDDLKTINSNALKVVNQKPIYCKTNDTFYKNAAIAADALSTEQEKFYSRQIRQSINRKSKYKGAEFVFITQEEFNRIKLEFPQKAIGSPFILPVVTDK